MIRSVRIFLYGKSIEPNPISRTGSQTECTAVLLYPQNRRTAYTADKTYTNTHGWRLRHRAGSKHATRSPPVGHDQHVRTSIGFMGACSVIWAPCATLLLYSSIIETLVATKSMFHEQTFFKASSTHVMILLEYTEKRAHQLQPASAQMRP